MSKRKRPVEDVAQQPLQQKRLKLLDTRKRLPIWTKQKDIQSRLRDHDVLVLSGETGSGKSTQIPQFLVNQQWCTGMIAVTQPRKVAAISLAKRVADEMGTPLGSSSPASTVGYSVRFDESTSPSTRIKFLTEGMLLQEMLRDSTLSQYSCVIVDEVHERSVNVDLILGFLKQLLMDGTRKKRLKVVVMSATADIESISHFFSSPKAELSNGTHGTTHTNDSAVDDGESDTSWNGFEDDEPVSTKAGRSSQPNVAITHVEGRQYPVVTRYLDSPTDDVKDAALQRILLIHCKEAMPGDILVFMEGHDAIQHVKKLVEGYAERLTAEFPKLLVLPLFAALPQADQQRIFQPAPRNTRKVILSTNIAETSITVPGVRFVIDTGKVKVKQFRSRLGMESLLIKAISQSSAEQRKGRAGRETAGQCYRLYPKDIYEGLAKDNKPEILMCDLSAAVLTMKARGVDDVLSFPLLTPPPREAIEIAQLQLLQMGALDDTVKITELGRKIARLPLTPALGRVLIEAARPEKDCLLEVIDIVACLSLSSDNIFLNVDTEEAREKAHAARSQLFRRQGDHLTMLVAVQGYAAEQSDRKRWADDHMISHRVMRNVMNVRKQLRAQCKQAKLLQNTSDEPSAPDETMQERILRCFIHGFRGNIAQSCPDGTYNTLQGNQMVSIHPSSFLFGRKVEAILYNDFVYTTKTYARNVSVVQLGWISSEILD